MLSFYRMTSNFIWLTNKKERKKESFIPSLSIHPSVNQPSKQTNLQTNTNPHRQRTKTHAVRYISPTTEPTLFCSCAKADNPLLIHQNDQSSIIKNITNIDFISKRRAKDINEKARTMPKFAEGDKVKYKPIGGTLYNPNLWLFYPHHFGTGKRRMYMRVDSNPRRLLWRRTSKFRSVGKKKLLK